MFNKIRKNKKVLVSGVLCNGEPFENVVMEVVDKEGNEVVLLDKQNVLHTALLADNKDIVYENEYCTFVTKVALKEPTTRLDVVYKSELHDELNELSTALKQRTIEDSKLRADIYRGFNEGKQYKSTMYLRDVFINTLLMRELQGCAMRPIEVKFDKLSVMDGQDTVKVLYAPTGIGALNEEIYFGYKEDTENIPIIQIKTPEGKVIKMEDLEREFHKLAPYSLFDKKTEEQVIDYLAKKSYKILGVPEVSSNEYLLKGVELTNED